MEDALADEQNTNAIKTNAVNIVPTVTRFFIIYLLSLSITPVKMYPLFLMTRYLRPVSFHFIPASCNQ